MSQATEHAVSECLRQHKDVLLLAQACKLQALRVHDANWPGCKEGLLMAVLYMC